MRLVLPLEAGTGAVPVNRANAASEWMRCAFWPAVISICAAAWVPTCGSARSVGAILGIVALVKKQSKGMSITGIVTGALAVIIAAAILVGSLFLIGAATDATRTLVEDVDQLVEEIESAAPETPEATTPAAESDIETEAAPEEEPEEDAAEPEWTTVAEISGNADQQSDTIVLTGGNVRVTYDFQDTTGYGMIVGAIYVLDEGVDIMVDGGIPDVMVTDAGSGETILRKGAGEYYVRITAANASYTVTVEELK